MEMEHTVAGVLIMDELKQSGDPSDLVYYDENGWWWYDESYLPSGPLDTRDEAFAQLNAYCRDVLGHPD